MNLSELQFDKLIAVLTKMAEKQHYTLTGADDWALLLTMFMLMGGLIAMVVGLVVYVHVTSQKTVNDEFDDVWDEMHRCQSNCLDIPPGRRRSIRRRNDKKSENKDEIIPAV